MKEISGMSVQCPKYESRVSELAASILRAEEDYKTGAIVSASSRLDSALKSLPLCEFELRVQALSFLAVIRVTVGCWQSGTVLASAAVELAAFNGGDRFLISLAHLRRSILFTKLGCQSLAIQDTRFAFWAAPPGREDLIEVAASKLLSLASLGIPLPDNEMVRAGQIASASPSPFIRHSAAAAFAVLASDFGSAGDEYERAAKDAPSLVLACSNLVQAARVWVRAGNAARALKLVEELRHPMSQHLELRADLSAVQQALDDIEILRTVLARLSDQCIRYSCV